MKLLPYLVLLSYGPSVAQESRSEGVKVTVTVDIKSKATGSLLSRDEKTRVYSSMEMCLHIANEQQAIAQEHLMDGDSVVEITCRPARQ